MNEYTKGEYFKGFISIQKLKFKLVLSIMGDVTSKNQKQIVKKKIKEQ